MNLFQTLEDAAGLGAAPSTPSSAPPGVMAANIQMLQSQPGGIPGVIQQFEGAGLGGLVQSWLGSAASQPVGPEQVEHALGQAPIDQVANQLGVSQGQAASHIAQFLPLILDHLIPERAAAGGRRSGRAAELALPLRRVTARPCRKEAALLPI